MPAKKSETDELKGRKTTRKTTTKKKTTTTKATIKKASAKKTSTKKAVVRKKTAKKSPAKESTRKKQPVTKPVISAEERHAMIAVHAYYQAEARGFEAGMDLDNWIQAEREIDAMLGNSG